MTDAKHDSDFFFFFIIELPYSYVVFISKDFFHQSLSSIAQGTLKLSIYDCETHFLHNSDSQIHNSLINVPRSFSSSDVCKNILGSFLTAYSKIIRLHTKETKTD